MMRRTYPTDVDRPENFPQFIKALRVELGLTQEGLAQKLGVSFATVNRWENRQAKPSKVLWSQLLQLKFRVAEEGATYQTVEGSKGSPLDFTASPDVVKTLAEGVRLSYGHLANPVFATEISSIDPLPHQRLAVYDHMLKQPRLRFLLADDAGAGKTIMSGLYIREMLARRLLRRILIVTPAGLVGNWRRELLTLFNLPFRIISGADARNENPFVGENSDHIIVSIDTLATPRVFARLQEPNVAPYDLVIFDEAHKLSAQRTGDRIRKTDRYCLAEALSGIPAEDPKWALKWGAHHLLLLTATPHMGKEYPYYALWRLLEPELLATQEAFNDFPQHHRGAHFLRRTKEEMVYLNETPIFPKRTSDTLTYKLTQGKNSEQELYDETTDYLRYSYNKAKLLNREAARLAMSVFQRRLASSTFALWKSFGRRIERLDKIIHEIQKGNLTNEQLISAQTHLVEDDVFDAKTADEESSKDGFEESEVMEDKLLQGVVANSIADLLSEKEVVTNLLGLAKKVMDAGHGSKFEKLCEILTDRKYSGEKFIVFTEHRDTLRFLVDTLKGMGYTDQIAEIHGGMDYKERDEQVEHFRKSTDEGGARFLICTDAAGEGINLQFCWIMINYDIPWNPARLEQRMGRIHRYLQKHDPVVITNMVSKDTREGKVLFVLLDKLEKIRKELKSDKVFDCIGRIFEDVSIKHYIEMTLERNEKEVAAELGGKLTKEQVQAIAAREKSLYGSGGDVIKELPRLREALERDAYFRLLPGYVRHYVQCAAPLVDAEVEGSMDSVFALRPTRFGSLDPLLSAIEVYPEKIRDKLSVVRPVDHGETIWLHPGEPVFESFRTLVTERLSDEGKRGAVFVDPMSEKPYLFHLALIDILRGADANFPELSNEETLECRLVGVKQYEGSEIVICPVEHLLMLKGGRGIPASAQRLAASVGEQLELVHAFLLERVAREMGLRHTNRLLESLKDREQFVNQGFDYYEVELAAARSKQSEKARSGNRKAAAALDEIKRQQRELASRKERAIAVLHREPELISVGEIIFIAHALAVPSSDPADIEQLKANTEMIAMKVAQAYEEAAGATVIDVHTPELARAAGLKEHPGFDLLSIRPGNEKRAIEVKGRLQTGDVEVLANEWATACNLRADYWLYVVYDCATPNPRLFRVKDPFGNLLAKSKGSVLVSRSQVVEAGDV